MSLTTIVIYGFCVGVGAGLIGAVVNDWRVTFGVILVCAGLRIGGEL